MLLTFARFVIIHMNILFLFLNYRAIDMSDVVAIEVIIINLFLNLTL